MTLKTEKSGRNSKLSIAVENQNTTQGREFTPRGIYSLLNTLPGEKYPLIGGGAVPLFWRGRKMFPSNRALFWRHTFLIRIFIFLSEIWTNKEKRVPFSAYTRVPLLLYCLRSRQAGSWLYRNPSPTIQEYKKFYHNTSKPLLPLVKSSCYLFIISHCQSLTDV